GVLINITGGSDMTLFEVNEAASIIQEAADEDANIIFGAVIDPKMKDEVKVTVIATGFDNATVGLLNTRGERMTRRPMAEPVTIAEPTRPRVERPQEQPVAAAAASDQVGAEGEIFDPPFFRNPLRGAGGTSGFGPMASNDFGADLDIPTVIRNLSD
ncbi:MAG: cell division protein FtsZ, partial [Thermoanaerobaculia bacterium]|nr:cell division protein FtsZ [Thermoanaerobaculia bacterium]